LVGLDSIGNGGHGRGFGPGPAINVNQVKAPAAPSSARRCVLSTVEPYLLTSRATAIVVVVVVVLGR
jgi:hypothetical protein